MKRVAWLCYLNVRNIWYPWDCLHFSFIDTFIGNGLENMEKLIVNSHSVMNLPDSSSNSLYSIMKDGMFWSLDVRV